MSEPLILSSPGSTGRYWPDGAVAPSMPRSGPPAVAPSMPRPSRDGLRCGTTIALGAVRIILGVALLGIAGVLMAVHLWSLRHKYGLFRRP